MKMEQNIMGGSRYGIEGTEDIGSGNKAIFRLEGGVKPTTGTWQSTSATATTGTPIGGVTTNTMFDRQAWVGLKGDWGQLKMGRDHTFAYDYVANGVLDTTAGLLDGIGGTTSTTSNGTTAAYTPNAVLSVVATNVGTRRLNNLVRYDNTTGAVSYGVGYSLGGAAGDTAKGSVYMGFLAYKANGLNSVVAYQNNTDYNNKTMKLMNFGALYSAGQFGIQGSFTNLKADAGYTGATGSTDSAVTWISKFFTASGNANNGNVNVYNIGGIYQVNPQTKATLAYYNVNQSAGITTGTVGSWVVALQYDLSKRTTLIGVIDQQNKATGTLGSSTAGSNVAAVGATTGFTAGIRHIF